MTNLQMDLKRLCHDSNSRSHATRAKRLRVLMRIGRELKELGYRDLRGHKLGERHVRKLVAKWKSENKSPGTMKNDLAMVRWVCRQYGRGHVLARRNDVYDIPRRTRLGETNKAQLLLSERLRLVTCPYVRLSLELQRRFGLRKAESIKFCVSYAWRKEDPNWIQLKGSWCKGGRARRIPVRTPIQRGLLKRVAAFAGSESLIPPDKTYKYQMKRYENECIKAGL